MTDSLFPGEADAKAFQKSRPQQSLVLDIALEVMIFDTLTPNSFHHVSTSGHVPNLTLSPSPPVLAYSLSLGVCDLACPLT